MKDRSYKFEDTENGASHWQETLQHFLDRPKRAQAHSTRLAEAEGRNVDRAERRAARDKKREERARLLAEQQAKKAAPGAPKAATPAKGAAAAKPSGSGSGSADVAASDPVVDAPKGCCTIS